MSSPGCPLTVTRPGFPGCLNCRWLPSVTTKPQPSASSRGITSRTFTSALYQNYNRSPDHARHSGGRLSRIPRGLPGGSHISSLEGVTDLAKRLFTGNRFHASRTHFIPPALSLGSPHLVNPPKFLSVETFHKEICQSGARFSSQRHGLLGQLFHSSAHKRKIL